MAVKSLFDGKSAFDPFSFVLSICNDNIVRMFLLNFFLDLFLRIFAGDYPFILLQNLLYFWISCDIMRPFALCI